MSEHAEHNGKNQSQRWWWYRGHIFYLSGTMAQKFGLKLWVSVLRISVLVMFSYHCISGHLIQANYYWILPFPILQPPRCVFWLGICLIARKHMVMKLFGDPNLSSGPMSLALLRIWFKVIRFIYFRKYQLHTLRGETGQLGVWISTFIERKTEQWGLWLCTDGISVHTRPSWPFFPVPA